LGDATTIDFGVYGAGAECALALSIASAALAALMLLASRLAPDAGCLAASPKDDDGRLVLLPLGTLPLAHFRIAH